MSDVKEVGVVGQMYEDRTTGKTGTLESRDEKCKTLMMLDSEGKGFSVSYSSFRSKWRKVVADEVKPDKVEPELSANEELSDFEVIKKFNAENNGVTIFNIAENVYSFAKDNFEIMRIKRADNAFAVVCLPDIYTDSVDKIKASVRNFTCTPMKESNLNARFILDLTWGKMLEAMHDAIVNVNLYGYVAE